jgi:hypothetical protein
MRKFSFRPAVTIRGRQFKGLRGWAGKPLHPPLTDVPILTGFWDWLRSTEKGTQARRTANAHGWTMVGATSVVLLDIGVRWLHWHEVGHSPPAVVGLSVAAAVLTALGAAYGGSMVFDYGFNVETAGDHAVWHRSEVDVLPGHHDGPSAVSGDGKGKVESPHALKTTSR